MKSTLAALAIVFSLMSVPGVQAQSKPSVVEITEWVVPWEKSRPRDPYVDGQGRVWFVGQTGNYVANLDPKTGRFTRTEIEAGTHPHNLIVDGSGTVWYAGNANGRIGRIAADGKITTLLTEGVRDPHTLVFDQKGDIWFPAQQANYVGRVDTKTGQVHTIPVPTSNSRPYGITVDSKNRPWFVEFNSNKLASIDPATMKITEHTLPNEKARARRLEATADGMIWYADYMRGMIARFDPRTGQVKEWPAPGGPKSLPYAMAQDDRGRLWITETGIQPNTLAGFDPKTERWFSVTPIAKSGGLTVRHMIFHKPTRTLWFGTDANTIARAVVP